MHRAFFNLELELSSLLFSEGCCCINRKFICETFSEFEVIVWNERAIFCQFLLYLFSVTFKYSI